MPCFNKVVRNEMPHSIDRSDRYRMRRPDQRTSSASIYVLKNDPPATGVATKHELVVPYPVEFPYPFCDENRSPGSRPVRKASNYDMLLRSEHRTANLHLRQPAPIWGNCVRQHAGYPISNTPKRLGGYSGGAIHTEAHHNDDY
jgi:hypothetical protein